MSSVRHEPVPELRDVQAMAPLGASLRSIHGRAIRIESGRIPAHVGVATVSEHDEASVA
jgi:hypothetical protein